jgi:P-type Mg2+ transporter
MAQHSHLPTSEEVLGAAKFWAEPVERTLDSLNASAAGLTAPEAAKRLAAIGPNQLGARHRLSAPQQLLRQFANPIILLLLGAALIAAWLGEISDTAIIFTIIIISGLLSFWQEKGATDAVDRLLEVVEIKTTVLRDGKPAVVAHADVVPGDVVLLDAGDSVPGDCLIIESNTLFVDEATLTGESSPVEKEPGVRPAYTTLDKRTNTLFMGTHVVSGTATALVIETGRRTLFGKISKRLESNEPETDFEHGVRRFGYLLLQVTLVLVIIIFAVNVFLKRPAVDSFLFSLALAVGLTPQLLPAIISVNLSSGARKMAARKVIVKRLASIENFGSMTVLCTDKTGTMTEGIVKVRGAFDLDGKDSEKTLLYGFLNAHFESSFLDPIDDAIRNGRKFDVAEFRKLHEIPYDFIRKRLTVLVAKKSETIQITKGALTSVLDVCSRAERPDGTVVDIREARGAIEALYEKYSRDGLRTLGVAYSLAPERTKIARNTERDMTFLGILQLADPPKAGAAQAIAELNLMGVELKMITGDNKLVAESVLRELGRTGTIDIMTGEEIDRLADDALLHRASEVEVFAEVEPNQKERVLLALRRAGAVVGYLGDGINDAPALRAADVGISVDTATDVAKEAAHMVLLEKDLGVLAAGVREGRVTFANTLKYVFMAVSANFGNMFSMAGASLLLPFLPLLPKQILLTNLLTDFPEMTISTDSVDHELTDKPRRWDLKFIRRFMIAFGLLSSVFDYATFGVLLFFLHASTVQFRTGWFIESVISAAFIVLVIRTRKPFYKSRPGQWLIIATILVGLVVISLPYTPLAGIFGFAPISPVFLLAVAVVMALYVAGAEILKKWFYRYND